MKSTIHTSLLHVHDGDVMVSVNQDDRIKDEKMSKLLLKALATASIYQDTGSWYISAKMKDL